MAVMVPVVKLWVNMAIDMVRGVAPVVPVMPTSRLSWHDYPAQHETPYEKTKCAVFHFPPPFPTQGPIGGPSQPTILSRLHGPPACLPPHLVRRRVTQVCLMVQSRGYPHRR